MNAMEVSGIIRKKVKYEVTIEREKKANLFHADAQKFAEKYAGVMKSLKSHERTMFDFGDFLQWDTTLLCFLIMKVITMNPPTLLPLFLLLRRSHSTNKKPNILILYEICEIE